MTTEKVDHSTNKAHEHDSGTEVRRENANRRDTEGAVLSEPEASGEKKNWMIRPGRRSVQSKSTR